jgi:hypothetical protein
VNSDARWRENNPVLFKSECRHLEGGEFRANVLNYEEFMALSRQPSANLKTTLAIQVIFLCGLAMMCVCGGRAYVGRVSADGGASCQ